MYYISDFCRVCLQYDKPLVDILKKEAESETLINKLKLCVSEVEWPTDESILMCQPCIEKLNSAFEFKRQCLQSAQALASYISQLDGSEDSEEHRVVSKMCVSVSRNEVSQELVDEYVKMQKEEEESHKPAPFIRVKSNQQLYPQIPNIILTAPNNTNQNTTFQNIFLNLIPSSAIKYQPNVAFVNRVNNAKPPPPPQQVKDANHNMFLNINNTLHKIYPIVTQSKENKPSPNIPQIPHRMPEDVNISRILTESKTEELSVEIDPMCFDCSPEDDRTPEENNTDIAKDWEELISSNKIGPEAVKNAKPNIPPLAKLPEPRINNFTPNIRNNIEYPNVRFEKPFTPVPPLNNYVPIRPKANKDFITAELEEKMMEFLNVDHFMAPKMKMERLDLIPKSLMCEQCGQMCDTLKALRYHIKQFHLGKFPYKCKYCSSVYALRTQYESHMQKHVVNTADAFAKDTITLEDLSLQNEALLFPTSVVPTTSTPTTPTTTVAPVNNIPEPNPNSSMEFSEDNNSLLEYKCENCPRSFNSAHGLSRHKVRKHNEQTRRKYFVKGMKNAKCDICNREFSTQSYLQLHIKLHYRKNDYRLKVFNKDKYEQEQKELQEKGEQQEADQDKIKTEKTNGEIQETEDAQVKAEVSEETQEAVADDNENLEVIKPEGEEKPSNENDVQSSPEKPEQKEVPEKPEQESKPLMGIKIKINLRNLKSKSEKVEEASKENINNSVDETPMEVDNPKEETLLNGDLSKEKEELGSAHEDKVSDLSVTSPDVHMDCDDGRELLSPNAELSEEAESLKDEGSLEARRPAIKIVLVDGKPQCTFCYKLFGRKHDLKRHLNNIHLKAIQYICHLCNSQFYEAFHLTRHLRQHNGFVRCTACMKDFSVLRDLKLHISSAHENCAPCQCGNCGQSFQRVKHLREHMHEHDKSIIYKCHICGDEFRESRELSRHLVAHSGMYACNICQTTFTNEQELNNHSKCHSADAANEKKYECEICHNRYKKKRYLMAHMNKSHSEKEVLNNRVESDNDSS